MTSIVAARIINYPATDFEKKTISTSIVTLTAAKIAKAKGIFITVESNSIRWRMDGGDPTSTDGHLAESGDVIELHDTTGSILSNFKMIRESADATVQITYF